MNGRNLDILQIKSTKKIYKSEKNSFANDDRVFPRRADIPTLES